MTTRYVVTQLPDRSAWAILDRFIGGYCTLPAEENDEGKNLLPLEWGAREGAEHWLYRCRVAWGKDLVPAPEGWNVRQPDPALSPWASRHYDR
jgi:hypothetical protein